MLAGPRSYALSLGAPLPSLYSVLTGRQQGSKVQVFTAGSGPPIATLEAGAGALAVHAVCVHGCPRPGASSGCCKEGCLPTHVGRQCHRHGAMIPSSYFRRTVWSIESTRVLPIKHLWEGSPAGGADEAKSGGLLSLLSRARGALPSRAAASGEGKRARVRGSSASLAASVWDEKRVVTRVSPSPW